MTRDPHRPVRLADEQGWIMVTVISLMTVMLALAFAAIAMTDTQQTRTKEQRERESSLNLAETALYQQGFMLARTWPTAAAPAVDCTNATVSASCPAGAAVIGNSFNIDTSGGTVWRTYVRDNGGPLANAWQTAQMNAAQTTTLPTGQTVTCSPCTYDANQDRKMWVQATAVVRGRTRSVVATLKLEQLAESVPQTAVVAGGINTGNNGSQVKIYAAGSQVIVRCTPPSGNSSGNSCVSDAGAIQPAATQGTVGNLMTPSQIERFKARAQADNTYYSGCPSPSNKWKVSGAVVFVENCVDMNAKLDFDNAAAATCSNTLPPKPTGGGNGLQPDCINSLTRPGLLIWRCGGFGTSGKGTFIGIMYFVNGSDGSCAPRGSNPVNCSGNNNSSNNVLSTTGGLGVLGAIAIDGPGCLFASANGIQVQFDPNVFNAVTSYGTVGLVQDTWRELIPN